MPPVAGFWRRLGAWTIDVILIMIIGQALGWSLSSVWFQVGPYGRFVGLSVLLFYFGVLNSKVGGGQTLGKRLLKVAVRDGANQPIGIGRSLSRSTIVVLPFILNGWSLPIMENPIIQWASTVIIFGGSLAIAYTMTFNRRARQGLHDLVCGTYVVFLPGKPTRAFPKTARIHLVVSAALLSIAIIAYSMFTFLSARLFEAERIAPLKNLSQIIQRDDRFFSAYEGVRRMFSSTGPGERVLAIRVWQKGAQLSADEQKQIAKSLARKAFDYMSDLKQYDTIEIQMTSSYDLGIAGGFVNSVSKGSVKDWQNMLLQH